MDSFQDAPSHQVGYCDRYQYQGLGIELLRRLLEIGKEERLEAIVGYILNSNYKMQSLCQKLGFKLQPAGDEGMLKAIFVPSTV